jgi:tetratricopeptide (TPR) repeat protein
MGNAHRFLDNYAAAHDNLSAALALAKEAGDHSLASRSLSLLASLAYNRGAYGDIEAPAREALAQARACGDRAAEAYALSRLGMAFGAHERDLALSRRYAEESLALYRQIGDALGISMCLNNLGDTARCEGDYATATRCHEESLAMAREIGERMRVSVNLFNLGELALTQNDYQTAARRYQEALAICQEIGRRLLGAMCLGGLGHCSAATGNVESARRYLRQALSEATAIGSASAMLYALVGFARLQARAAEPTCAAEWLGLVLAHPASEDGLPRARRMLEELKHELPAETLQAAMARGAALDLDEVVAQILRG